ncbi:MAG: CsbD family protein [Actinomycetota bacterium]|nr:CsbD family protein [Actinomycetota bacterium]MDQ6948484.1 CsbD family protein [Actinomycetota bacterium]
MAKDDAVDTGKRVKGEVKEVVGAVTGDRGTEAAGRAEQRVADPQEPEQEETDESVRRQAHAVRQDHHDVPAESDREGPLGT